MRSGDQRARLRDLARTTLDVGERVSEMRPRNQRSKAEGTSGDDTAVADRESDDSGRCIDFLVDSPDPSHGLQTPWRMGVGDLLGDLPGTPAPLRRIAFQLNRFGEVALSSESLTVDGCTVPWNRLEHVAEAPALHMLTSAALDREAQRLTRHLRLVPYRKWVLKRITDLFSTACTALVLRGEKVREADAAGAPTHPLSTGSTISSIRHRGRFRTHEVVPGLFVSLVLAAKPQAVAVILEHARAGGATIESDPRADRVQLHSRSLQNVASEVRSRFARISVDEGPTTPYEGSRLAP